MSKTFSVTSGCGPSSNVMAISPRRAAASGSRSRLSPSRRGFFRHAGRLRDPGKRFLDNAAALVEHGGVAALDPLLIGLLHGCLHLTPALSPVYTGTERES